MIRRMKQFALAATLALLPAAAVAQSDYPSQDIRYLLHVSPGGATDIMARQLAIALEDILDVTVVVENMPGGRGAAQLAKLTAAEPDGYTIGSVTSTHIGAFNQTLKQYDIDSVDWIARLVTEPYLLVVPADSEIQNMADLAEAANAEPGSIVMAGFVRGSGGHFAWEIMADAAGLPSENVRWVPYDSVGDAVTATLGGHADVAIAYVDLVQEQVEAGNLRVIGIMADERVPQFPDAPTLAEQGYEEADTDWQQMRGIIAPPGMPEDVKAKLVDAIEKAMQAPEMQAYIEESALVPAFMGPEEFTEYAHRLDKVTEQWMKTLGMMQ